MTPVAAAMVPVAVAGLAVAGLAVAGLAVAGLAVAGTDGSNRESHRSSLRASGTACYETSQRLPGGRKRRP